LTLLSFKDSLLKNPGIGVEVKKYFPISRLLLALLLCELFVQAQETSIVKNLQLKQHTSNKEENISELDGKKWKALSFEQKCSLYHGYELGRIMTVERVTDLRKLLQNVTDKTVTKEMQEEFINLNEGLDIFLEMLNKYKTILACDEMVNLVDKFYYNPENQNIRLHHAFVINKLIKNGESEEVIKELIDIYRKKDSQKKISDFPRIL
jgi:hypothetical protein